MDRWARHPNAETLGIGHVFGQCVIFRIADFLQIMSPEKDPGIDGIRIGEVVYQKGTFNAIFIPEESLLPEDPRWEFMWEKRVQEGKPIREIDRVVKAKKLRGIFSCGMLIPVLSGPVFVPSGDSDVDLNWVEKKDPYPVGYDMAGLLRITKYEQPEKVGTDGDNESAPKWMRRYTDIENALGPLVAATEDSPTRFDVLRDKTVVMTEKLHGSNARLSWRDGRFWVGSHNNMKTLDSANIWTSAARRQGLDKICEKYPGFLLFGEVVGPVQKGYDYGLKHPTFVLFDIVDVFQETTPWLSWDHVQRFAAETGVPIVPELYRGPWISLEHALRLADGPTVFGKGKHGREGCVVKADPEEWDEYLGRVILKVIGSSYLLSKYGKA
jgi:RNA ligase (TIGR02306 family)